MAKQDHTSTPDSWDGLRKQARKLEGQLDTKLLAYRKLASSHEMDTGDMIEKDIDALLQELQNVNLQMQSCLSFAGSEMFSHTLARQKDILHEFSQEFKRLKSNFKAKREHKELVENFGIPERRQSSQEEIDHAQEGLIKEQKVLLRSTGQLDSVITHAQTTFGALMSQRGMFNDINSKIIFINAKLPSVNGVLTAIRRKKARDTIILSLVAAACTFLILIYWLSK